jgi:hypothetical protein
MNTTLTLHCPIVTASSLVIPLEYKSIGGQPIPCTTDRSTLDTLKQSLIAQIVVNKDQIELLEFSWSIPSQGNKQKVPIPEFGYQDRKCVWVSPQAIDGYGKDVVLKDLVSILRGLIIEPLEDLILYCVVVPENDLIIPQFKRNGKTYTNDCRSIHMLRMGLVVRLNYDEHGIVSGEAVDLGIGRIQSPAAKEIELPEFGTEEGECLYIAPQSFSKYEDRESLLKNIPAIIEKRYGVSL